MTQWGLDALFNPAKRHMDEEKRRLQATREQIGDNSGGDRIDLDSGRVVIKRKKDGAEAAKTAEEQADSEAETELEQVAQAEHAPTIDPDGPTG